MDMLRTVAEFYREIYRDRHNHLLLLAWYVIMIVLAWCLFLAQDRWLHADVNAAAFDSEPAHHACAGFDTVTCYAWLGELDQQRREVAVHMGACQSETQCRSTAPEKDPLLKPAPCAGNGGCATDKALWYRKAVCPRSERLWSPAEQGVLRRLVVGRTTASPCGAGSDLLARPDLREAGLPAFIYLFYGLFAFAVSPVFVAIRAFRRIGG